MNLSNIKVLIIEDSIYKAIDIQKALNFCGINNIIKASNQEMGFAMIHESNNNFPIELIITDMHYPLNAGMIADDEAGFKLIDRLKDENINIPIIICSSKNYKSPDILGTVWYNKLRDLNLDFKEILTKL